MDDEWGPWIEHDGKGCPCVGQPVEVVHWDGRACREVADTKPGSLAEGSGSWVWGSLGDRRTWSEAKCGALFSPIIRYRIRRPKALQQLRDLVENLPAVKECEGQG